MKNRETIATFVRKGNVIDFFVENRISGKIIPS